MVIPRTVTVSLKTSRDTSPMFNVELRRAILGDPNTHPEGGQPILGDV